MMQFSTKEKYNSCNGMIKKKFRIKKTLLKVEFIIEELLRHIHFYMPLNYPI